MLRASLDRLLFEDAQNGERERFDAWCGPLALAARADLLAGLAERRAQPLAGDLQEAKREILGAPRCGAVLFERVAQPVLHLSLAFGWGHVDELITNRPPRSRSVVLVGDLVSRLRLVFKAVSSISAPLVARAELMSMEVSASMVDDDGSAGGEPNLALEGGLDLESRSGSG